VMLDAGSLEPLSQAELEGTPRAQPRIAGDQVLVELKTDRLISFNASGKLERLWELALEGASLTGNPLLIDGRLLVALNDGRVLWLDATTGQVERTVDTGQQLGFGPRRWGENLVVGTLDGTLVLLSGSD